jgi:PhoH-like ATPase
MPLPKLPTKPATLLSTADYPKAEKGKSVKPVMTLVESTPQTTESAPKARAKTAEKAPAAKRATSTAKSKPIDSMIKSTASRVADRMGVTKMFVLDNHKKGMSEVARNAPLTRRLPQGRER